MTDLPFDSQNYHPVPTAEVTLPPVSHHPEYNPQPLPPTKPNQVNLIMLVIIMILFSALTGFIGFYLGYVAAKPVPKASTPYPGTISTPTNTLPSTQISPQSSTKPATNPITDITTPSTKQWGPESLWGSTPGKSLAYLKQNVTFTMPAGWQKLECSSDIITLNPIGGVNTCETEGDAFAIILAANSPYHYQSLAQQNSIEITEKRDITVGVWPAVEYQVEIIEGPYMGRVYFETVIFRNESEYVYVTLNDLSHRAQYDQFLANLQIN